MKKLQDFCIYWWWRAYGLAYFEIVKRGWLSPSWIEKEFDDMSEPERSGYFTYLREAFRRVERQMTVTTIHGLSPDVAVNWAVPRDGEP